MKRMPALLATLILALAPARAPATTPEGGTLTPDTPAVTWEGAVGFFPFTPEASVVCAAGVCDEFRLTVALGPGFWGRGGGSVEITALWAPYRFETDLDLFVYDAGGNEVARSAGFDSNAESVFLRNLADGEYRIVVAPSSTSEAQPFRGLAQVELDQPHEPGPPRDLLPNLVPLAPDNFHVSSAANLLPFPENPVLSCYPEETIESSSHPTRCLRFDQTITNVGEGRLELRFDASGIASPDEADKRMVQRIYRTKGARDRLADVYEFHAAHAHIHYRGFGQSLLYAYEWGAGRTGDGLPARTGNKVGFCVVDVFLLEDYFGGHENGPRSYSPPTCLVPTQNEEGTGSGTWMVQGIDVGWGDIYGWNLADQYIDISGAPDGVYELEQIANPTGSVLESSYADNRAFTIICIDGDVVTKVATAEQAAACAAGA